MALSYRMIAMLRGFERGVFSAHPVIRIDIGVTSLAAFSIKDRALKRSADHTLRLKYFWALKLIYRQIQDAETGIYRFLRPYLEILPRRCILWSELSMASTYLDGEGTDRIIHSRFHTLEMHLSEMGCGTRSYIMVPKEQSSSDPYMGNRRPKNLVASLEAKNCITIITEGNTRVFVFSAYDGAIILPRDLGHNKGGREESRSRHSKLEEGAASDHEPQACRQYCLSVERHINPRDRAYLWHAYGEHWWVPRASALLLLQPLRLLWPGNSPPASPPASAFSLARKISPSFSSSLRVFYGPETLCPLK